MPNYDNTTIYMIRSLNPLINDTYIGVSTDLDNRASVHKHDCNNEKTKHLKLYETINSNGGWTNWEIVVIEKYKCSNLKEARIREEYWIQQFKPKLNKNKSVVYNNGEALIIDDVLTPTERNRQNAKWRNHSISNELQQLRTENEQLKKEKEEMKQLLQSLLNKL
jgi:predicted GIY-YIG superfamily endonuclease